MMRKAIPSGWRVFAMPGFRCRLVSFAVSIFGFY